MKDIETIDAEPWVNLADEASLAAWTRDQEIAQNQRMRHAEKYKFYVSTFDFLKDNNIRGDYYEFGCHRVRTFRMALTEARKHSLDDMRFYAFDSFEGLPEVTTNPSTPFWQKGALCTSLEKFWDIVRTHGVYLDNIDVVRGFYDQTLTQALQNSMLSKGRPAFVCIDCDLYESAVPVFQFLEPMLQEGTVIYLDDYFAGYRGNPNKGVARAFREFSEASQWRYQPHLSVGWYGRSFIAYR